jgi:hypothetical protein
MEGVPMHVGEVEKEWGWSYDEEKDIAAVSAWTL